MTPLATNMQARPARATNAPFASAALTRAAAPLAALAFTLSLAGGCEQAHLTPPAQQPTVEASGPQHLVQQAQARIDAVTALTIAPDARSEHARDWAPDWTADGAGDGVHTKAQSEAHARALTEAQSLLRAALEADPFYAPAMNNLAALMLSGNRADLREAATLLDGACKLMPGSAPPRYNLGLALERAALYEDALAAYAAAQAADPAHMPSLQSLVSLQMRRWPQGGRDPALTPESGTPILSAIGAGPPTRAPAGTLPPDRLRAAIQRIAADGTTPHWRAWAADILRRGAR